MSDNDSPPSIEFESPDGGFRYKQWRDDEGFHRAVYIGRTDFDSAGVVNDTIRRAFEYEGEKIVYIMDLTELKEVEPAARKRFADYVLSKDTPLKVFASFGGAFYIRSLVNLFAKIATTVPLRVHKTEEAALQWVHQELEKLG